MRALDNGFSAAGFLGEALRGEVLVVGVGTGVDDDCDSETLLFFPVRLVGAGVDSARTSEGTIGGSGSLLAIRPRRVFVCCAAFD